MNKICIIAVLSRTNHSDWYLRFWLVLFESSPAFSGISLREF